jgi:deazaflavin-dependent oxidoreductase (nitroreductase family)
MTDMNDVNQNGISEFRENGGVVGGMFEGMPMLVLHSTGAKSGLERLNPLAYQQVGESWAIFASKAGAPTHPDWYHNVVAGPDVTIEVGTDTLPVRARVAESAERDEIYARQAANIPQFAEYEVSAGDRVIPVVVLERV